MESLFRLLLQRPAVQQPQPAFLRLAQNTPFQNQLLEFRPQRDGRAKMKDVAQRKIKSPDFIRTVADLALAKELESFADGLEPLADDPQVDRAAVAAAINQSFGDDANAVVRSDRFRNDVERLRDSMVAIKLVPAEHQRPLEQLSRALRLLEIVRSAAANQKFPEDQQALRRAMARSFLLPDLFGLGSILAIDLSEDDDDQDGRPDDRLQRLLDRFRTLQLAIKEFGQIRGHQLSVSTVTEGKEVLPPKEFRPTALFDRGVKFEDLQAELVAKLLRPIKTGRCDEEGAGRSDGNVNVENAAVASQLLGATTFRQFVPPAATEGQGPVRTALHGHPAFIPPTTRERTFLLNGSAIESLSASTLDILQELSLNPKTVAVDTIANALQTELEQTFSESAARGASTYQHSFRRLGSRMLVISTPILTDWSSIGIGLVPGFGFQPTTPPDGRIPQSHGSIAPVGVADLLIVKQQLVRYEAVDVAHIENVLKGEQKVRKHRRRRETEEFSFRESEVTTTEERDLESTDRFEMTRETSETIKNDASLKAGLTISGSYGPTVEFSASAEGSISTSKERAIKTASSFAKEVTERSSTKITERILQRESLKVNTEVEENNEHQLNNVGGDGHISGVYQWVEKVHEAQMFNYGLRTMFDFMVPEPGAFLIETLRRSHASGLQIEKPLAFTLLPYQINESNYHFWVHEYGATDIQPPPEPYITKSFNYAAGGGDKNTDYTHSAQIDVDDGYMAIHAYVAVLNMIWESSWAVDMGVGRNVKRFEGGDWTWSAAMHDETGSVPIAFTTDEVSELAVAVEIKCQRTEHAMSKWRHETHAKLTNAYRAGLAEYEEKLSALEINAGVAIEGQNPALNLELMKDELKKACITIMTEQHYDLFDAIDNGSNGLPQVNLFENEAEGPYVRFFEQAFEWENMTWVTYPYFWGRKSEWPARIAFEDVDPLFNQFLKAGYSRVAVPVRPGFEGAVDHFMTLGELWAGGPLPIITSPLFLPIADEIAERLDRPGDEIPEGDPWEVRIPTTLVKLRDDDSLPVWQKDAEGRWVPQ